MIFPLTSHAAAAAAFAAFCCVPITAAEKLSEEQSGKQSSPQASPVLEQKRDIERFQQIIDRTLKLTGTGQTNSLAIIVPTERRAGEELRVMLFATITLFRSPDGWLNIKFMENPKPENSVWLNDPERKAKMNIMIEGEIGPPPEKTFGPSEDFAGLPLIIATEGDASAAHRLAPLKDAEGPLRVALLGSWNGKDYALGFGIHDERTPGRIRVLKTYMADVYFTELDSLSKIKEEKNPILSELSAIPKIINEFYKRHAGENKEMVHRLDQCL